MTLRMRTARTIIVVAVLAANVMPPLILVDGFVVAPHTATTTRRRPTCSTTAAAGGSSSSPTRGPRLALHSTLLPSPLDHKLEESSSPSESSLPSELKNDSLPNGSSDPFSSNDALELLALTQESKKERSYFANGSDSSSSLAIAIASGSGGEMEMVQANDLDLNKDGDGGDDDKKELGLWAARGILLLVAVIWATNFAAVKYMEDLCFHPPCNHFPSEAAFCRFGVAALVSSPLLWIKRQDWDVIKAGLECGLWISLGYGTQALALGSGAISAGKCAFICSLTVVFVPLLQTVAYGKPLKLGNVAAALIALSGVAVLEGMIDVQQVTTGLQGLLAGGAAVPAAKIAAAAGATTSTAATTLASSAAAGANPLTNLAASWGVSPADLVALGQAIGFGSAFARIEYYQEKYEAVEGRVLTIAAAQCVAVGTLALMWMLYDYHGVFPDLGYMMEPHRLAGIAWTGIVTTVFAIFLEGIALQKASATDAAITFATEPVWAGLFGFWLLHEQLGMTSYIGGAIILLGCMVGSLSDMPQNGNTDNDVVELTSSDS